MNRSVSMAFAVSLTLSVCFGCSLQDGKLRESRSDVKTAEFFSGIKPLKGNPESHFRLACYYQDRGRHREAVEEFTKVVAIDLKNADAYNRLGVSYDKLGEFRHAEVCYQKALQLNPSLYYVHNNIGYSRILQGDFEAAAAALTRALSINSGNKTVRNNLELAYTRMQRPDLAMPEFEKGTGEAAALANSALMPSGPPGLTVTGKRDSAALNDILPELSGKAQEKPAEVREKGTHILDKGNSVRPSRRGGVEISNGNGVSMMARDMGRYLKAKGFKVVRFTNARHFKYRKATIVYRDGYGDEARRLAEELPGNCEFKMSERFVRANVKIRVLIGKEMAPYKKMFKGGSSWS